MLSRISLRAALPALLFAVPALADAPADCRNMDLGNEARLAACEEALAGVTDPALRAELLDFQGRTLRRLGDDEGARALFDEARRLAPGDGDPLVSLAHLLHDGGDRAGARALFDEALALEPDTPRMVQAALWNRAETNDLEACLALAPRAVEIAPDDPMTWALRGRCLGNAGNDAQAIRDYRQAIDLGLEDAFVYDNLSVSLLQLYRYDEALEAARHAHALDPQSESARVSLMGALASTDQVEEAVALYHDTRALGIPDTMDGADHLAWSLYRRGHFEEALPIIGDWLARHPEPSPGNASELDTLAHILAALGRPEAAADAWMQAAQAGGQPAAERYAQGLDWLGHSAENGLRAAFLACAATGALCRFSD